MQNIPKYFALQRCSHVDLWLYFELWRRMSFCIATRMEGKVAPWLHYLHLQH